MRKQHLRTILVVLLVGIFVILAGPPVVYSQFLPCNVVSLAPTGPPTVEAGQTLQVTTAVTGSCDQSMFYAVRVDLADGRSSQVLSSVVFPYVPVTPGFTVSITNKATAPTTLGSWVLQVNAYLIAAMNGGVVASAHQLFSVVVVPYTATTTTTEQMITNSTTTLSQTSTNSTNQAASTNETLVATSTSSAAAPETVNQISTFATVAAVVVILAAIIIVMLSKRKHATNQKPQPQLGVNVKYCEHCGTELNATDEFCGHCGTKQT
ncbi:MAG: zinc ribbon domain-containing protein [Candidatus Bathyarchaeia archaeon]